MNGYPESSGHPGLTTMKLYVVTYHALSTDQVVGVFSSEVKAAVAVREHYKEQLDLESSSWSVASLAPWTLQHPSGLRFSVTHQELDALSPLF